MVFVALLVCAATEGLPAGAVAQVVVDPVAEVEARERAFAQMIAGRDLEAFLTFVSPEAVFFGGCGAIRGRAVVARECPRPSRPAPA